MHRLPGGEESAHGQIAIQFCGNGVDTVGSIIATGLDEQRLQALGHGKVDKGRRVSVPELRPTVSRPARPAIFFPGATLS